MVTANFLFFIIIFFLPPIKTEGVWEHCTIRFKLEREYRAILYNIPIICQKDVEIKVKCPCTIIIIIIKKQKI